MEKTDNEIIAEFMGEPMAVVKAFPKEWKYDTSWDWLMPVVEKIDLMYSRRLSEYNMNTTEINRYTSVVSLHLICSKALVYKKVLTFIKYYNSLKPKQD
jgi:hypothetical protein